MAAPGQPGYQGQSGYVGRSPWFLSRFIMFLGFVCFAIAALVFGGIFHGPAWAWMAGGFAAYLLALAVP